MGPHLSGSNTCIFEASLIKGIIKNFTLGCFIKTGRSNARSKSYRAMCPNTDSWFTVSLKSCYCFVVGCLSGMGCWSTASSTQDCLWQHPSKGWACGLYRDWSLIFRSCKTHLALGEPDSRWRRPQEWTFPLHLPGASPFCLKFSRF